MVEKSSIDRLEPGAEINRPAESSAETSAPPAYEETADVKDDASTNSSIPPDSPTDAVGPDAEHPFNFPALPPAYTEAESTPTDKLFAIPQLHPSPTASFVNAYPTALLSYGIPADTWLAFVTTISSFLDASVSKHAVRHATKVAKTAGDVPKNLGKDLYTHTTGTAKTIGRSLKKGNPFGVIGPIIGWPMGVAGRVVGSVFALPGSVMQKPETPRQRAEVYIATANKKWLNPRKLQGVLLNTTELAQILEEQPDKILEAVKSLPGASTVEQLQALRPFIGENVLKVNPTPIEKVATGGAESTSSKLSKGKQKATDPSSAVQPTLQLGTSSLWLVIGRTHEVPLGTQPTDVKKPLN